MECNFHVWRFKIWYNEFEQRKRLFLSKSPKTHDSCRKKTHPMRSGQYGQNLRWAKKGRFTRAEAPAFVYRTVFCPCLSTRQVVFGASSHQIGTKKMGIPIWRSGSQDRRPESPKWHENSKASVGCNVSYLDLPKGAAWFLKGVNSPFVSVTHGRVLVGFA